MAEPVCVVVGYGPGNGQGIARSFGRAGHRLGLIARTPAKQAAGVAELRAAGLTAEVFAGDAGDEASLTAALRAVAAKLGDPAVLVYNAAAFRPAVPTQVSPADLVADFRTNVAGALAAARAVLPAMKAHKSGAVLFTGGGWAVYPSAAVASIAIGKAGLRHLALMLHEELAGTGVRAGTLTIMGAVAAGTAFDPDRIGEAFVRMATAPADQYQPEERFTGQ